MNYVPMISQSQTLLANVSFTGNNRINFQSGDTIGYYLPNNLRHNIRNIQTAGYTSYTDGRNSPRSSFSITSDTDAIVEDRQPLIQVMFGNNYKLTVSVVTFNQYVY